VRVGVDEPRHKRLRRRHQRLHIRSFAASARA
jgi:hypothetical protein